MADEIANSTPAPVASTAPTAEAAASTTETPVIETPAPETTPAPAETPAVEPAKVEPTPEVVTEAKKAETLLAGEKKAEAPKPEEKPTEEAPEVKEEPKEEPKPAEVVEPKYEFKLPEGVTFEEAKMGEVTKMFGDFEIKSKVPHEEMQALGQQMIERHLQEMQRYTESLTQAWNKQKNDWKDSFLKDPEFANRTDTVLNSAIDTISVYGGNAAQQQEFRELMESTGVGNHPAMIRLLANVIQAKQEPKPLAAPMIASPVKTSKISKMYGNKKTG